MNSYYCTFVLAELCLTQYLTWYYVSLKSLLLRGEFSLLGLPTCPLMELIITLLIIIVYHFIKSQFKSAHAFISTILDRHVSPQRGIVRVWNAHFIKVYTHYMYDNDVETNNSNISRKANHMNFLYITHCYIQQ